MPSIHSRASLAAPGVYLSRRILRRSLSSDVTDAIVCDGAVVRAPYTDAYLDGLDGREQIGNGRAIWSRGNILLVPEMLRNGLGRQAGRQADRSR